MPHQYEIGTLLLYSWESLKERRSYRAPNRRRFVIQQWAILSLSFILRASVVRRRRRIIILISPASFPMAFSFFLPPFWTARPTARAADRQIIGDWWLEAIQHSILGSPPLPLISFVLAIFLFLVAFYFGQGVGTVIDSALGRWSRKTTGKNLLFMFSGKLLSAAFSYSRSVVRSLPMSLIEYVPFSSSFYPL